MIYYFLMILMMIISIIVSFSVKSKFKKYSKYIASSNLTGAEAARLILNANGIHDVNIYQISGNLTDNYNPLKKTLNLSADVYNKNSISAICVAAHECGHAIQHASGYAFLNFRKVLVPFCNISSSASYVFILLGIFFNITNLIVLGTILFSVIVLFNLVTLPVEIDASKRALRQVLDIGILSSDEIKNGKKVLIAAGLTYFIALVSAILQLLRLLSIINRHR